LQSYFVQRRNCRPGDRLTYLALEDRLLIDQCNAPARLCEKPGSGRAGGPGTKYDDRR
jgi:hypothetical protein